MIRPATAADAAAVAAIHARARSGWDFPTSRALDVPEAVWAQRLAGDEAETVVLARGGAVVGFASFCDVTDEDLLGQPVGELLALYVDPDAHGSGAGSALLSHVVQVRRGRGDLAVVAWVFARNAAARRFYERRGWRVDAAADDELRYRLELG